MVVVVRTRYDFFNTNSHYFSPGYFCCVHVNILFYYEVDHSELNILRGINMSQTIETIIDRIKNLTVFDITVEMPSSFEFDGRVPFDIFISGSAATFKVYAANEQEAKQKVDEYLGSTL